MSKSQTKILYLVTQSDFGGAQRYVYDLSTNISNNFSITVASGQPGKMGELARKLKTKNIPCVCLSHLKRSINPWHDFLAFWQIVRLIKKERPDIIHLNSSKVSILGSLAVYYHKLLTFNFQLLTIYTVHGWVFNEEIPVWKKYFYLWCERLTARFKDKIICLSEFDKQNAINRSIAPVKKITVIHNGREAIKFLPRAEARKKLNIASDAFCVGSIGNLYANKGYEYLIKASKLLITHYPLLITAIIGSGPKQDDLELRISTDKHYIKLLGSLPDASQYLKAFDLYACSSTKEGLPYTVLEAMQAGLPIVSTSVGAIPEVITDKKNGLLVEPKNAGQLAEKIQQLIDSPALAQKLGRQAHEDMLKNFSLEQMVTKTLALYKATINNE